MNDQRQHGWLLAQETIDLAGARIHQQEDIARGLFKDGGPHGHGCTETVSVNAWGEGFCPVHGFVGGGPCDWLVRELT